MQHQIIGGKENVRYSKNIDVSKIKYSDIKSFGDHAKIMYMTHEDGKPIYIQTLSLIHI